MAQIGSCLAAQFGFIVGMAPFSTHRLVHRTNYSVLCTFSVISQVFDELFF
ncbi:hypothetical protein PVAP13_5NG534586 [Panicum virgatum]|uniref:Uncharacterized protein n=1 Tax=Panicum virgatum TaxID=38727 RepID=A0A8T0S0S0_PANVG|nr:hypothetical protein PVAP13_5NG534586 [Panicum virgatum]